MSNRLKIALSESTSRVEDALFKLSMFTSGSPQISNCAYSLYAGGKRLRPFFVLQSNISMGGNGKVALPAACSVEMVHTYSLIHDDLPGMDDDDTRRGKPALHKICGTKKAVYAGDRLLIEAFRALLKTNLPDKQVKEMLHKFCSATGSAFLVGGQFMDMYHPTHADKVWTQRMIRGKTSAMIRVSMELGTMAAGVSLSELEMISSIGDDVGWLFQLTDDILDVIGTTEEMGKAVAKDAEMGKWNPVSQLGVQGAIELAYENASSISNRLDDLNGDWSVIRELVEYLPERRK